jgi:hypothetical protein
MDHLELVGGIEPANVIGRSRFRQAQLQVPIDQVAWRHELDVRDGLNRFGRH